MADDKDAELARRCAQGDAAAWASRVERYHWRFVQVAYRTVGDHDAAEDLAQEAFVQIYLNIHTFRAKSRFLTWAYQVLKNVCLMHLRAHKADDVPLDEMTDDATLLPSPEDEFFRREEARWIQDALASLPPQPRMALSLRAFEEMECDEIAAVMGVPLGTVLSWIHRGRVALKKRWQKQWGNSGSAVILPAKSAIVSDNGCHCCCLFWRVRGRQDVKSFAHPIFARLEWGFRCIWRTLVIVRESCIR